MPTMGLYYMPYLLIRSVTTVLKIKKAQTVQATLLLDGRRKPEDKDVGKAAHAYGVRTACFLASSKISYVF